MPPVRLLATSWRVRTIHEERWRAVADARRPYVLMAWHEALLPILWRHRRQAMTIVVSGARDGQYLGHFAESLGYGLLSGSSTRGGVGALRGAIRVLAGGGAVGVTPDGPRGPRRELKVGVLAAARHTGALIVPVHAAARRAWMLHTWDRMLVPKPFAEVRIAYGEPFSVPDVDGAIEQGRAAATAALTEAMRSAAWPADEAIPTV